MNSFWKSKKSGEAKAIFEFNGVMVNAVQLDDQRSQTSGLTSANQQVAAGSSGKVGLDLKQQKALALLQPQPSSALAALEKEWNQCQQQALPEAFLYTALVQLSQTLMTIYNYQIETVKNLANCFGHEPKEFLKVRINQVVNEKRVEVQALTRQLKLHNKLLRTKSKQQQLGESSHDQEVHEHFEKILTASWENWLKATALNQQVQSLKLAFLNQQALYDLQKLQFDYQNDLQKLTREFECEFAKFEQKKKLSFLSSLNEFNLDAKELRNLRNFLKNFYEYERQEISYLKWPLGKLFVHDKEQIGRISKHIRERQTLANEEINQLIQHYKQDLLKQQQAALATTELLVTYVKKRYQERINMVKEKLDHHVRSPEYQINIPKRSARRVLDEISKSTFQKELLELQERYQSQLKKLENDYCNYENLLQKDLAHDRLHFKHKLGALEVEYRRNLVALKAELINQKALIEQKLTQKSQLIIQPKKFIREQFQQAVTKLETDCKKVVQRIEAENARYWRKCLLEFDYQCNRDLIAINYEYFPWHTTWKTPEQAWMEEYLNNNVFVQYLNQIGKTLTNFSPEGNYLIAAAKLLDAYNQNFKLINETRDLAAKQNGFDLNTLPMPNINDLKNHAEVEQTKLKIVSDQLTNLLQKHLD